MPVVEASVVLDWVAPDVDPQGPAGRLLTDLAGRGEALYGSSLLGQDVANALMTGTRRGRWDGATADASFSALERNRGGRADWGCVEGRAGAGWKPEVLTPELARIMTDAEVEALRC